jgi:hypothetical protein
LQNITIFEGRSVGKVVYLRLNDGWMDGWMDVCVKKEQAIKISRTRSRKIYTALPSKIF